MTLNIRRCVRPALAVAFACLANGAMAQSAADLQRVEITASAPRLDVRASCPGIDQALPLALGHVWQRGPANGVVNVQFDLSGDDVEVVSTRGGPRDYHTAIRRAVRSLNCTTAAAGTHRFAFQIAFRAEPTDQFAPGRQTIALLQTP